MATTRAAIAELIGTFAVVFVAAGASTSSAFGLDVVGIAIAYGAVVALMMTATGHLGGGHVNPALTVAVWVSGRLPTGRAGVLVASQLLGALLAGLLLRYVMPGAAFDQAAGGTPALSPGLQAGAAVVIEAVGAFVVVFAVFATRVDAWAPSPRIGGAWVGASIAALVLVFYPLTGAALNPARWFGPAAATGTWSDWFVWVVGPLSGGVIASVLYTTLLLRDQPPETP